DGGRESLDRIDVGFLHQPQELARVRGQRLDVAALPLCIYGIERQRRLPRARQPRDDRQAVPWDGDVDVAEVVLASAANDQGFFRHSLVNSRVTRPDSSGPY